MRYGEHEAWLGPPRGTQSPPNDPNAKGFFIFIFLMGNIKEDMIIIIIIIFYLLDNNINFPKILDEYII